MRKRYLYASLLTLSPFFSSIQAQSLLTVNPGTDLYVSPGTSFTVRDLSLMPSANFILNGNSITKTASVANHATNNYVRSVYKFSANTAPFSGTIRFGYTDAELNGMAEGNLAVNIYRGDRWINVTSATNDVLQNYVLTNSITGQTINEIALADAATPLPLTWGMVTATRDGRATLIRWHTSVESNVSHFDVERSTDGANWVKAISNIPAENTTQGYAYKAIDQQYITTAALYRIRQTDFNGQFTFSKIVAVAPLDAALTLTIFPNPVIDKFQIINTASLAIRQVSLFNNAGTEVRKWASPTQPYEVGDLPKGIYHLTIVLNDGKQKHFKLIKQ